MIEVLRRRAILKNIDKKDNSVTITFNIGTDDEDLLIKANPQILLNNEVVHTYDSLNSTQFTLEYNIGDTLQLKYGISSFQPLCTIFSVFLMNELQSETIIRINMYETQSQIIELTEKYISGRIGYNWGGVCP